MDYYQMPDRNQFIVKPEIHRMLMVIGNGEDVIRE